MWGWQDTKLWRLLAFVSENHSKGSSFWQGGQGGHLTGEGETGGLRAAARPKVPEDHEDRTKGI